MSEETKKAPAIRFQGFTDDWEQRKLEKIFGKIRNAFVGTATPYYVENGHFYLESNNVKDGKINRNSEIFINDEFYERQRDKWLHTNDLVMVQSGHVGHTAVIPEELDGTAAHALIMFQDYKVKSNPYFLNYQLHTSESKKKLEYITTGNTIKHILASEMKKFEVTLPNFEEQTKIGTFFKHLDDTIALHQRQLDNCKQLKNSMMQKIFNQELRFKDENGKDYPEWQKYDLSEIVDRVTRKNTGLISELPLTISAQYGLVDQLTFFNKTIAGVNLEAYYLLKNGEFAYNKSYSSGYPLGAIKRLDKYDAGLLSTLYICFSPRNNVDSDFLTQYFESTKWHKQIVNISGEGARNHGLLNIAVGDFFNTEHILPCKEEQQQIATLLYSLDNMIDLSTRKVDSLNEQKKELMKRMFV